MEKINNKKTIIDKKNKKAEKGTVSIRKRGNSFEARVRLELKNNLKGGECSPRLSRSAQTEELARQRLAELIIDTYLVKENRELITESVFSEECEENLKNFTEYFDAKEDIELHQGISSCIDFYNFAVKWLNFKKESINQTTNKKISPKTVESYAYILKKYIKSDFSQYKVQEADKKIVEEYIAKLRKKSQRTAKDVFLMIRQILKYAKSRGLIKQIPQFELKFPKKKRSKNIKFIYIPSERQPIWLDILENDGRSFCKLFATLLQSGMRPEEGCGLLLSNILFDKDMICVENAYKDTVVYDYNFNIIGHKYIAGDLKTEESYREIPMSPRLKKMLKEIYEERKELREKSRRKFDPSKEYVFLNTIGTPYIPERLDQKLKSIIKKYGLEHMTVYGFRHSFATLMSENGMKEEVLKEIMGHSDYETTQCYYIFISDKRKKEEFSRASNKSFGNKEENKLNGTRFKKKKIKAPTKISA